MSTLLNWVCLSVRGPEDTAIDEDLGDIDVFFDFVCLVGVDFLIVVDLDLFDLEDSWVVTTFFDEERSEDDFLELDVDLLDLMDLDSLCCFVTLLLSLVILDWLRLLLFEETVDQPSSCSPLGSALEAFLQLDLVVVIMLLSAV